MEPDEIPSRDVPWQQLVVVCRKCTRKLDGGGFGKKRRHPLRTVLKDALKLAGRRREVRVLETGCLGLCPKHAVTMVRSAAPGELLAVPAGTDAARILDRIMPPIAAAPE